MTDATSPAPSRGATPVVVATVVAVVACLLVARPAAAGSGSILSGLLPALLTVLLASWLGGRAAVLVGQPAVVGEVTAGLLLGPSALGRVAPELSAIVLPSSAVPHLASLAEFGVVLYLFTVGLELNADVVRRRAGQAAVVAAGGVLVPFGLGVVLAQFLYPDFAGHGTGPLAFSLFVSAAMSVTAFPVLARILTDRGASRTEVGILALGSAAVDDVAAWCMLAGVVGVAQDRPVGVVAVLGLTAAYVAVMVVVVRPVAARHLGRARRRLGPGGAVLVMTALLASSLTTEAIGIHALFGAFLLGAVIPCDGPAAVELRKSLSSLTGTLMLPAFFAVTGLRADVGQLAGVGLWTVCAATILVATAGKCGGALAAARLTGLGWRDSAALGVLMNTRGLMELIVLNVGLQMGVITGQLFAALVVMALVTTAATGPALWLLGWRDRTTTAAPWSDQTTPVRGETTPLGSAARGREC